MNDGELYGGGDEVVVSDLQNQNTRLTCKIPLSFSLALMLLIRFSFLLNQDRFSFHVVSFMKRSTIDFRMSIDLEVRLILKMILSKDLFLMFTFFVSL